MGDDEQGGAGDDLGGWGDALDEQAASDVPTASEPEVAEFDSLQSNASPTAGVNDAGNLDTILDIPVTLSMELGRTKMTINNLLKLNQGSVVELDRLAGEPLDVLVNGCLVAHGEVVVVNDRFGVRMTDILSPKERVKTLA
ncbi:MAG: flagellar motor switch protein FliN [Immundisolibacteraceae bacterium]|nr:flagellar motor switch protein FliN [Immundisolibacteraceae bacterium]